MVQLAPLGRLGGVDPRKKKALKENFDQKIGVPCGGIPVLGVSGKRRMLPSGMSNPVQEPTWLTPGRFKNQNNLPFIG